MKSGSNDTFLMAPCIMKKKTENQPVRVLKYVVESGGFGGRARMFYGMVIFCNAPRSFEALAVDRTFTFYNSC